MSFLVKSVQKRVSGKEGTGQKIALQKDTQRKRKKRSQRHSFLSAVGTKIGFFRLLLTRTIQGQVEQFLCMTVRLAHWRAGLQVHGATAIMVA